MADLTCYTSGFFLVSATHAYWRGYMPIVWCTLVTFCTSLTYHYFKSDENTYKADENTIFQKFILCLDMTVVHTTTLYGIYILLVFHWLYILALFIMVYVALIYWINGTNTLIHAIFHCLGNISIMLAVEANHIIKN
jgi:hypothetical protein